MKEGIKIDGLEDYDVAVMPLSEYQQEKMKRNVEYYFDVICRFPHYPIEEENRVKEVVRKNISKFEEVAGCRFINIYVSSK